MERWIEHFDELLNCDPPENPMEDTITQTPVIQSISTDPVSLEEVRLGIVSLRDRKAGGSDNIVAELLKADLETSSRKLHGIITIIWEEEVVPDEWLQSLIVKLPKKGDLGDCNNWRGITLLVIASKVLGKIIFRRMKEGAGIQLRPEQAGFMERQNTTEQIFILRNTIEQACEWQSPLLVIFIDFEKAFDWLHRNSLWVIMRAYGIPEKLINIVKLLINNAECAVLDNSQM